MTGDSSVGITAPSANIAVEFCVLLYGGHSFSFVVPWRKRDIAQITLLLFLLQCLGVLFERGKY
jgi:hypothetical protein